MYKKKKKKWHENLFSEKDSTSNNIMETAPWETDPFKPPLI